MAGIVAVGKSPRTMLHTEIIHMLSEGYTHIPYMHKTMRFRI